jgi:prophage antirepressor-like protein
MDFITEHFNSEEVKSFVDENNITWLNGTHVCKILEYQNPSVSIPYNVDECDRRKFDIGGLHDVWFVNKCGLYDLILSCKKPIAKPFHKWISHTLLPSIEEKGYYIARNDAKTLAALEEEIQELKESNKQLEATTQKTLEEFQYFFRYFKALNRFAWNVRVDLGNWNKIITLLEKNPKSKEEWEKLTFIGVKVTENASGFIRDYWDIIETLNDFICARNTVVNPVNVKEWFDKIIKHLEEHRKK